MLKDIMAKVGPIHTMMMYGGWQYSSSNSSCSNCFTLGEKKHVTPRIGGRKFCKWGFVLKLIAQLYFCATVNVAVFCDMTLCSQVEIYWPTLLITRLVCCALHCVLLHTYSLHDDKI